MGALAQAMLMTRKTVAPLGPPTDDFNRADSTTTLGVSTSGHTWVPLGGSVWGISSNQAYIETPTTQTVAYLEASDADVSVEARLHKSDASNNLDRMGIAFRITDNDNYLYAYFLTSTSLRLFKKDGGGTQLGSAFIGGAATGDLLSVTTSGDQISVFHNGVLSIGPITETYNQTATKHGLFREVGGSNVTLCRWDDFLVTF